MLKIQDICVPFSQETPAKSISKPREKLFPFTHFLYKKNLKYTPT